jgi:hypothetical protein
MTYCVAIKLDDGLVFASDSRTNAGVDQVSTYSKMHTFETEGDRIFVVLTAGNLATTQAVVNRLKRDMEEGVEGSFADVAHMSDAAEYLGRVNREEQEKHSEALSKSGIVAEATLIIGGQIQGSEPEIYRVYPQGNYITTSQHTPFLQIGESKYGKPILDRIIRPLDGSGRRHPLRAGFHRLDDALQPDGGPSDRGVRLRGRFVRFRPLPVPRSRQRLPALADPRLGREHQEGLRGPAACSTGKRPAWPQEARHPVPPVKASAQSRPLTHAGLAFGRRLRNPDLRLGFHRQDGVGAVDLVDRDPDPVACGNPLEETRVADLEHHRHRRHVEIGNRLVPE